MSGRQGKGQRSLHLTLKDANGVTGTHYAMRNDLGGREE